MDIYEPFVRVKNCYENEISEVLDISSGVVQIPIIITFAASQSLMK